MPEADLLAYLSEYGFEGPSLRAAFAADPRQALERLYEASYPHAEGFTPEVLDLVLERFDAGPREVFWILMGEYGFASCLSLRGVNVWSAVSSSIDIDKAVVWARDPAGNIVGRRLIALTPRGLLSYRTYANRHGLALDPPFEAFLEAYAAHCGVPVTRGGSPGPLLSDKGYDDGAL